MPQRHADEPQTCHRRRSRSLLTALLALILLAGSCSSTASNVGSGQPTAPAAARGRSPAIEEPDSAAAGATDFSIDLIAVSELFGPHSSEILAELRPVFHSTAPDWIVTMQAALASHDAGALCDSARALKSDAQAVGALKLAGQCEIVEKIGEHGCLREAAHAIEIAAAPRCIGWRDAVARKAPGRPVRALRS